MNATYTEVIDGRTYEGHVRRTPKGRDVLHVRGPMEYRGRRQMHHLYSLTDCRWSTTPEVRKPGGVGSAFLSAGSRMANRWYDENEASA